MSFETDLTRDNQKARYIDLQAQKTRIERLAQDFMTSATALHSEVSADPQDQAEIIATRDTMISNLRTIFGI